MRFLSSLFKKMKDKSDVLKSKSDFKSMKNIYVQEFKDTFFQLIAEQASTGKRIGPEETFNQICAIIQKKYNLSDSEMVEVANEAIIDDLSGRSRKMPS